MANRASDDRHREVDLLVTKTRESVRVVFPLRNTSDREMHVLDAISSCGCSSVEVGKRVLAAGEETELSLTVTATAREQRRSVSCTVLTDDALEPNRRYTVVVRVIRPVQFRTTPLDFGDLESDCRTSKVVVLEVRGIGADTPARVVDVRGNSSQIQCEIIDERLTAIHGGLLAKREVAIRVQFETPSGMPFAGLVVKAVTESNGRNETVELPVEWRLKESFVVSPRRVLLRPGPRENQPLREEVVLRRRDGKPFEVCNVRTTDSATNARVEPRVSRSTAVLSVEFSPSKATSERYICTVIAETNHESQRTLVVPVIAIAPATVRKKM